MTINVNIFDPTSSVLLASPPPAAGPNYSAPDPSSKKYKITGDANSNKIIGGNFDDTINGFGGNDSLYGLNGNDSLDGGDGHDSLDGGDGHDYLDGGLGNDSLTGGSGNDTYVIDSSGDTINNSDAGIDLVRSSVAWVLGSGQENLTLLGSSNINGTGNLGNNTITGNTGNNSLNGGDGADTLIGSNGNDTYVIGSLGDKIDIYVPDAGTDLVQSYIAWALGSGQEDLTLFGSSNINGTGNLGNNKITGNTGNNALNGAGGSDTLVGSGGDDTYVIDSSGDIIDNNVADDGNDLVQSYMTWTLGSGQENLTLFGYSNISGTGNLGNNIIIGNTGNNSLNGAGGTDIFFGANGNDTYIIDSYDDKISTISADFDRDLVKSSVTWTLGTDQEDLTLTGISAISGIGNNSANYLTGNNAKNTLIGNDGNDTLDGRGEADTLQGGKGDDLYFVQHRDDIVIETADDSGTDHVKSSVTYALGAYLENLTLLGSGNTKGIGNYLANSLVGNSGNNFLDGGDGRDTLDGGQGNNLLAGGAGDDYYFVNSANDTISESQTSSGYDIVESTTNWKLQDNFESLIITKTDTSADGNSLDNRIYAHATGNATLSGGSGNDSYFVRSDEVIINEIADQGTEDSVFSSGTFSLKDYSHVENLYLGGRWSSTTNVEYGANFLYTGGYFFQKSAASVNGTGNSQNNVIYGTAGDNRLDGGAGDDTLAGGTGNDTYVVDAAGDYLTELSPQSYESWSMKDARESFYYLENDYNFSIDLVESSVTWTLGEQFEDLQLTGTASIHGYGSETNNRIVGNNGDNSLYGNGGDDFLCGDTGADTIYGNDIIDGGTGNDTLVAGGGNNTLYGGTGSDVYHVYDITIDPTAQNPSGITVIQGEQAGLDVGGFDVVYSPYSWTLGDNLEDLVLKGTYDIDGTGNDLDNDITGNSHNNLIRGDSGDDTISSGKGADTLEGGTENDSLDTGTDSFGNDDGKIDWIKFSATSGNDTVETGYSADSAKWDRVVLDAGSTATLNHPDNTFDLVITVTDNSGHSATLTVLGFYDNPDLPTEPSDSGDPISRISGVYDESGTYLKVNNNNVTYDVTYEYLLNL